RGDSPETSAENMQRVGESLAVTALNEVAAGINDEATEPASISSDDPYEAEFDITDIYFEEIGNILLLNKDQERALAASVQASENNAIEAMIESNLRFVVKIANRYEVHGLTREDLIQEGNIGLMEAVKRFDPKKKVKF